MSAAVAGVPAGAAASVSTAPVSKIRTDYVPRSNVPFAMPANDPTVTPIYMFGGHGHEEDVDFEHRDILPEGVTLVALSEFGSPTIVSEICPFQAAFAIKENRRYFENPRRYQKELDALLGRPVRIYEAGTPYPKLYASLTFTVPDDEDAEIYYFGQSGVLKFPTPTPFLRNTETDFCQNTVDAVEVTKNNSIGRDKKTKEAVIKDFVTRSYQYSVFPTVEDVQALFDADNNMPLVKRSNSLEKKLMYPVSEILEKTGAKGVYYHVICRAVREDTSTGFAAFARIRSFEDIIKGLLDNLSEKFEIESRETSLKEFLENDIKPKFHRKIENLLNKHLNKHLGKNETLTDIVHQLTALKEKHKPIAGAPTGGSGTGFLPFTALRPSVNRSPVPTDLPEDETKAKALIARLLSEEETLFAHERDDPMYERTVNRVSKYRQFLGSDQRKDWIKYVDQVIAFVDQDNKDYAAMFGHESEYLKQILRQLNTLKTQGALIRQKSQEFQNLATQRAINAGLRNARRSRGGRRNRCGRRSRRLPRSTHN